ncbi:MAG: hypothetical protein H6502_03995 [Candidatus Woesearchaeota archaeon]|nr:MAG: hypothetical protein H6502_03995 [Candidatus Woesearchaeota archaeon]
MGTELFRPPSRPGTSEESPVQRVVQENAPEVDANFWRQSAAGEERSARKGFFAKLFSRSKEATMQRSSLALHPTVHEPFFAKEEAHVETDGSQKSESRPVAVQHAMPAHLKPRPEQLTPKTPNQHDVDLAKEPLPRPEGVAFFSEKPAEVSTSLKKTEKSFFAENEDNAKSEEKIELKHSSSLPEHSAEQVEKQPLLVEEDKHELLPEHLAHAPPEKKVMARSQPALSPRVKNVQQPFAPPSKQDVSSDRWFYLCSGGHIKDIKELVNVLDALSDDIFYHHVTHDRNDFSTWINDVFHKRRLASLIRHVHDKREMTLFICKFLLNEVWEKEVSTHD